MIPRGVKPQSASLTVVQDNPFCALTGDVDQKENFRVAASLTKMNMEMHMMEILLSSLPREFPAVTPRVGLLETLGTSILSCTASCSQLKWPWAFPFTSVRLSAICGIWAF